MTIALITGAAGFIGSHLVDHLLQNTDYNLVFLDKLDCAGNLNRLAEIRDWDKDKHRCKWVYHDLRAEINTQVREQIGKVDIIIHLAAGTHVDRSILDPISFVYDNVVGTANILEYARKAEVKKFLNFSTDEVFGPAPDGVRFKEWDRYKSGNPYSATKAGAIELGMAYHNTYGLPVITTMTMNAYGQKQHPEKYVPKTIANVRDGKVVVVHASPDCTVIGSRFYIHARNIAAAVLFLLEKGETGEKYNVVGDEEVDNLSLAQKIAECVGKRLNYRLADFHSSRKGHDLRYALDGSKLKEMGFSYPKNFDESLQSTVEWTLANPRWLLG